MIKNYFYLLRNIIELNKNLTNAAINEFYSQEKDKIYIRFATEENPHRHLIISAEQNLPYLYLKDDHRKAKKNTINFWDEYVPATLLNIKIAVNERVIKFCFDNFEFYFFIRGNLTNVFLMNNKKEIHSFKKTKKDEAFFIETISNLKYIDKQEELIPEFKKIVESDFPAFRKQFPHIGREIYKESSKLFSGKLSGSFNKAIGEVIENLLTEKIAVEFNSDEAKLYFIPETFSEFSKLRNPAVFTNFNEAIKYYLNEYYHNFEFNKLKKEIDNFLDKELHRYSEKINKLRHRIESGSKEEEYRKTGNLLLSNIYLLRKGLTNIILTDYESDKEITVKLKETNSPNQNVNLYFEKAKDEKINYAKSVEIFDHSVKKYEELKSLENSFISINTIKELREIKKQLKIGVEKKLKKETKLDIKYKQYRIDEKYNVYVGRDSRSNDLLTIKFAKQNDYWFHARGLPGSHVVLRSDTPKEVVPKPVLKKAAAIAAFHSKAKTAGIVPVSYTFAKYVYKKKGLNPGQVHVTKAKVLTVQPEIPSGCELITE